MEELKLPSGICFDDQTIAIQNICTEILIVFIGEYKLELKTLGHKFRHLATSLVSAFDQCSPRIAWALCCSIEDRCDLKKVVEVLGGSVIENKARS